MKLKEKEVASEKDEGQKENDRSNFPTDSFLPFTTPVRLIILLAVAAFEEKPEIHKYLFMEKKSIYISI